MNSSAARIGYARVSTADQNLDAQLAALEAARCTIVRTETGDGATLTGRPELKTILDFIHPGETLVVTRIDRLARSMRDLQLIVATLKDKGAHLAATEQPVDTSTAAGKAFFDMLGVFAEFETNLRRERQAEGIAAAKQRGAYRGRPPRIDMEAIQQRLATGLSPTAIARELKVSRGTVYKARAAMTDGACRGRPGSWSRPGTVSSISRCDAAGSTALRSSRCPYMHVRAVWALTLRLE